MLLTCPLVRVLQWRRPWCGWWTGQVLTKDVWRFSMNGAGGRCAMMCGIRRMETWCVGCWGTKALLRSTKRDVLDKVRDSQIDFIPLVWGQFNTFLFFKKSLHFSLQQHKNKVMILAYKLKSTFPPKLRLNSQRSGQYNNVKLKKFTPPLTHIHGKMFYLKLVWFFFSNFCCFF